MRQRGRVELVDGKSIERSDRDSLSGETVVTALLRLYQFVSKNGLADYRSAGFPLVWILNPRLQTVSVVRPEKTVILEKKEQLSGEGILPAFLITVADLFPPLLS